LTDFFIKEGDRQPYLVATLVDENEAVIDLTAAITVKFFMINPGDSTPKVNGTAAEILNPPGTNGKVRYLWGATDTDTPGDYDGEFEVAWSDGTKTTFPNFRFITIRVLKSIDTGD
jgi:Rib/alpha/Esp surface antigen-like repeat protein